MEELTSEEKQNVHKEKPNNTVQMESRIPLLFLGMLIISVAGYFVSSVRWVNIITNHLGGLGITGLLACLTGFIAKKKGYNHSRAFLVGLFFPIVLGFIAVVLVYFSSGFLYCGGGVILAASLVIIIIYSLIKKKNVNNLIES